MTRETGISVVGKVSWDSHFCVFYHDKEELISVVAPYLKAGIEANEACIWVLSDVVTPAEAREALQNCCSDLDDRFRKGQIEILDAVEWYTPDGKFDSKKVLAEWQKKAEKAKARGFEGLRATGDTSWLHKENWNRFVEYESSIGDAVQGTNMLVLCTYKLDLWEAYQVVEVVSTHEFSLIKVGDKWRQIENSERRKSIEDTLSAEEKYRRAVENIRVAVYSALPDEHSTSVLLTDKIEDITGYSVKEHLADPELFARMVHPEDRELVWSKLEEHRKKKTQLDVTYRIMTKAGQVKWVQDTATPVLDRNGEITRIDGFMEDITEKQQLVEAVRSSEERFKMAQKAANIGSWDWDVTTGNLVWSDEIEPMFGFEKGKFERTYEAFLKSVHPEDRQHVTDSVNDCVEKGILYDIEHRISWPDGTVHWLSEKGDAIRDRNGKAVRMLGVVRDITGWKQTEQKIIDLNMDLERKTRDLAASNRELEAFAYSVSHDLRAPLRRIDGFSEIILQTHGKDLNKSVTDSLGRIRASVKNMDGLIEGMLRLSNLTTAGLSVKKVDLSGMAKGVVHRLQASDPDRKVSVSIQSGLIVRGDPDLLNMALENLIGNSWKFTSKRADAKIEFGSSVMDGRQTYFVRDNGIGFDRTRTDRMFAPFQRLHNEADYPGHGVGLAIVSRIVARHNGRVWADGERDKGASFYFTLGSGD
jgi:PAS domain S-box-containing protein